jgi:energy-coupling factor transporter ATP-binding protein EcfA2
MTTDSAEDVASEPHNGAGLWLESIELCDNSVIPIPTRGVTAIVGGNNVGKSTLLRQIKNWIINGPGFMEALGEYRILKDVSIRQSGSAETFLAWIEKNAKYVAPSKSNPGLPTGFTRVGMQAVSREALPILWESIQHSNGHLGQMAPLFCNFADATERLGYTFNAPPRGRPDDPPVHALHYVEDSPEALELLDNLYNDVFREHLTLDKLGSPIQLRIGHPPETIPAPGYHDNPLPFRQALDELHTLDGQGDGMRSLMALLLPILTAQHQIVIADEPEAFLHPPQARKLGKILGDLSKDKGVQVILATHDKNIIVGLLESKSDVSIVRLTRDGNITKAHQLEPSRIKTIWSNPILRYSNVLDGLFHRVVVLAEHDRDCKFYAAALDAAHEDTPFGLSPSEILFVPTAGKDAMSFIAAALTAIKVPTIASPDLDILDDETKMRRLVEGLGQNWNEFEKDYRISVADVNLPREQLPVKIINESVVEFFDKLAKEHPNKFWNKDMSKTLNGLSRAAPSAWEEVKKYGTDAFKGTAEAALIRLLANLDKIGLVAINIGVLENFAKGYGLEVSKGPNWLKAALEEDVHRGPKANAYAHRIFSSELSISKQIGTQSEI